MCNIIQKMGERGVPAAEIKEHLRVDHKIEADQPEIDRICVEINRKNR